PGSTRCSPPPPRSVPGRTGPAASPPSTAANSRIGPSARQRAARARKASRLWLVHRCPTISSTSWSSCPARMASACAGPRRSRRIIPLATVTGARSRGSAAALPRERGAHRGEDLHIARAAGPGGGDRAGEQRRQPRIDRTAGLALGGLRKPAGLRRRSRGDGRAGAAPGDDDPRLLEELVGAGHGAGGEPEIGGMGADRGQPVARRQLAGADLLDDLAAHLLV